MIVGEASGAPPPTLPPPTLLSSPGLNWRAGDQQILGVRVCLLVRRPGASSPPTPRKKKSVWDSAPLRPDGGAAVFACFKLSSRLFWQLLPAEPNPPDTSLQVFFFFFLFYRQRFRGRSRQPETGWFGQTQVSMNSTDRIPKMQQLSFDGLRTVLS